MHSSSQNFSPEEPQLTRSDITDSVSSHTTTNTNDFFDASEENSTGINCAIRIPDDEIELIIKKKDYEEFEKYKDVQWDGTPIDHRFYAGFTLGDRQLYAIGSYPQEEQDKNNIIMYVESVKDMNGEASSYEEIKGLACLNGKKEIKATNISKHPLKLKEEAALNKITKLQAENQKIKNLYVQSKTQLNESKKQVEKLNTKITALKAKNNTQEVTDLKQQLTDKDKEITALKAKNKTTEQPKQDNKAKYTATVGMGLAAGLIAFTGLERTVRLEMLVMIGIAVTSALVVGGITYAVLPGTQVDGA